MRCARKRQIKAARLNTAKTAVVAFNVGHKPRSFVPDWSDAPMVSLPERLVLEGKPLVSGQRSALAPRSGRIWAT